MNPDTGALKINFPGMDPTDLAQTCGLDVADRGGVTLEEVGALTNITRERVRQVEMKSLYKIRRAAPELSPPDDPRHAPEVVT